MKKSNLIEMNNIGIVVENLDNAISFFSEIGLKVEGRGMVEGEFLKAIHNSQEVKGFSGEVVSCHEDNNF